MGCKPLISIVIPVYNIEGYIKSCIISICEQTYTNLEIIVIDDGSTDRSGKICDDLAMADRRIKVYHYKNGGLSMARNRGIDMATGEAVLFVDGDDVLSNVAIEVLVNEYLKHKEVAYVSFGFQRIIGGEKLDVLASNDFRTYSMPTLLRDLLSGKYANISVWGKLFPLSNISNIRFSVGHIAYEDKYFLVSYLIKNNKYNVYETETPHYGYTIREQSITTSKFNESSTDAIYHSKKIIKKVKTYYPEYLEEAEFFDVVAHLMVLKNIIRSKAYCEHKELFRKIKESLLNKYRYRSRRFFKRYFFEYEALKMNDGVYIICVKLFDLYKAICKKSAGT